MFPNRIIIAMNNSPLYNDDPVEYPLLYQLIIKKVENKNGVRISSGTIQISMRLNFWLFLSFFRYVVSFFMVLTFVYRGSNNSAGKMFKSNTAVILQIINSIVAGSI